MSVGTVRRVEIGVFGAVRALDAAGAPVALGGPRQRAVLARLVAAHRRVVPVDVLVADLWAEPPRDPVGTVRTFVAALRRGLEPERAPRTPARVLVTEGPGYALRLPDDAVDVWRFAHTVEALGDAPPARVVTGLSEALSWWRGPAYAEAGDAPWALAPRSRLTELRSLAVERLAAARIELGDTAAAVADLDAHVVEHPWREDAWHLLALALYRAGRQADALTVLRRARAMLRDHLGLEPGPRLSRLEQDILRQAGYLDRTGDAARLWAQATAAYDSTVSDRVRLESTVGLMRDLAVTGGAGLDAAQRHRAAAVTAAEQLGDPILTARVIGAYDVPAVWPRSDDPSRARSLVRSAERALAAIPDGPAALRCRLLATIAVESRGVDAGPRAEHAAGEAERSAREMGDAPLLAYALNGVYMQSFARTGLAAERAVLGERLVVLGEEHGLVRFAVLGRLINLQSACATNDLTLADTQAQAADELSARHDLPLVGVFTTWYRALRTAVTEPFDQARDAYLRAAELLPGSGMPGLADGLLPLALLGLHLQHHRSFRPEPGTEWGPAEPWIRPLLLAEAGDLAAARLALRGLPDPPRDPHAEALWCVLGRTALLVGDQDTIARAHTALLPAAAESAGAAGGLFTAGPVADYLAELEAARN
ncbi:AfsR/SARP family transcriptional regulator [Nocardia sp. GTS18]|uniref:AfsR/SARP family transcriptional regulator n=1 Tax=Nocardia sp. GTS18 TaxID=1778064 RepID=UPI0015EE9AD8|nr:AfsR/SARP family transcriptional regulator [Nocardia sp. GTS18]